MQMQTTRNGNSKEESRTRALVATRIVAELKKAILFNFLHALFRLHRINYIDSRETRYIGRHFEAEVKRWCWRERQLNHLAINARWYK
ncbi:hypothetical protein L596_026064 [Steinernema carpocapsae]|uniref:Uncharacterized protein n=1 Tax=Steinernema carpocapsae TaxID=34508 RepID=A0A4U5M093_STECR|nr:hypothetical protein L596_026064 [Steinernema carpocapsae]